MQPARSSAWSSTVVVFNETLVANVHPADWVNPTLAGRYNLVVIGAGTAGLITSLVASTETTQRT